MKKIFTLIILALLVLTTAAERPQSKGVKSAASAVPQTTLPDSLNRNAGKDSINKETVDTLSFSKEETKEADTGETSTKAVRKTSSFPWVWVALPTLAFLLAAVAYRNVRRRYERVKERLDDAEQQLSDVRLLQNADKEQIHQQLQQMEKDKVWLARAKTDAERAQQQADKEVEKLQTELKGQQAENDQLCDKNMQLSKQLKQITEQYDQLKADIANTTTTNLTNNTTDETVITIGTSTNLTNETNLSVRAAHCISLLDAIYEQVQQTEGASPVIIATLRQMQNSMTEMMQAIEAPASDSLEELFVRCLRPSGWMNNAAQLFAYSRLPQLCTQLRQSGVNIAILEELVGQAQALLGTADMSMTIPAVLATDFDKDAYDYQNGDVWINKMFSGITPRDFEGKVFDILQVGYTIGTKKTKPVVKF